MYNPDIDKIANAVWKLFTATEEEKISFRNEHYGKWYDNYSRTATANFSPQNSINLLMFLPSLFLLEETVPTPTPTFPPNPPLTPSAISPPPPNLPSLHFFNGINSFKTEKSDLNAVDLITKINDNCGLNSLFSLSYNIKGWWQSLINNNLGNFDFFLEPAKYYYLYFLNECQF